MHKKIKALTGLLALVIGFAVLMVAAHRRFFPPLLKSGETFPVIQLELKQGQDTAFSNSRRVFMLYKPSCTHCQRTIGALADLYRAHKDWFSGGPGITVNLVDVSGGSAALPAQADMPFAFYADQRGRTVDALKGSLVPYQIFVDENNVVRYSHTGELTFNEEQKLFQEFYKTGRVL